MIGRSFTEAEDRADAKVVVLSHAVWQSQFGGNPSALGHSVDLDGEPFRVIGVMPVDFAYQLSAELFRSETFAELWMPLGVYPGARLPSRGSHNLAVVARLLDGVTLEVAQSQMSTIAGRLASEYPASNKGWDAFVEPLHESVVRDIRTIAMVLVAAVGFVLIIGCANIGGLLVARQRDASVSWACASHSARAASLTPTPRGKPDAVRSRRRTRRGHRHCRGERTAHTGSAGHAAPRDQREQDVLVVTAGSRCWLDYCSAWPPRGASADGIAGPPP